VMPISIISDMVGQYIVFQRQLLPIEMFPYQIVKTRLGLLAIVPPDVYEVEYLARIEQSKAFAMIDPNQKYLSKNESLPSLAGSLSGGVSAPVAQ